MTHREDDICRRYCVPLINIYSHLVTLENVILMTVSTTHCTVLFNDLGVYVFKLLDLLVTFSNICDYRMEGQRYEEVKVCRCRRSGHGLSSSTLTFERKEENVKSTTKMSRVLVTSRRGLDW
jgi:hypothetical protein